MKLRHIFQVPMKTRPFSAFDRIRAITSTFKNGGHCGRALQCHLLKGTIQGIAMRMRTSYKLKMQENIASMPLTILVGDFQPCMS